MKHRLIFKAPREVASLKIALDANLSAVFEAFSGLPFAPDTDKHGGRAHHSMEMGRDLAPNSPFVDDASSSATIGEFIVHITADVAWWNPREAARCSFNAHLEAPGGASLRLFGARENAASVKSLEVDVTGPAIERTAETIELLSNLLDTE